MGDDGMGPMGRGVWEIGDRPQPGGVSPGPDRRGDIHGCWRKTGRRERGMPPCAQFEVDGSRLDSLGTPAVSRRGNWIRQD